MDPLFFEIFECLSRQGPGGDEHTRRAFFLLPSTEKIGRILDLGCGAGMPTLTLAEISSAEITALDSHAPFIEQLKKNAAARGVAHRIHTVTADMADLNFPAESFDLIWCEGAVFGAGSLENAFRNWRKYLIPGGFIAVTELTQLTSNPHPQSREFWERAYPPVTTIAEGLRAIERSGYRMLDHFILPDSAWWNEYYTPLEEQIKTRRPAVQNNPDAISMLDGLQEEVDMFRNYPGEYGYVFYVAQKSND